MESTYFNGPRLNIVVIGSAAREHALSAALNREGHDVSVAPGNPCIPGSTLQPASLAHLLELGADLYVFGPEQPLVDGMADKLRQAGRLVFGPGASLARLEGSKIFMKNVLVSAGVPTARSRVAVSWEQARLHLKWLQTLGVKIYVVKTDYLNEGKGVKVTTNFEEAMAFVEEKCDEYPPRPRENREARKVIIEEGFVGPELSQFVILGGLDTTPIILPSAKDYKRLRDGDEGPNTGGMGSYSPLNAHSDGLSEYQLLDIYTQTTARLIRYFNQGEIDYRGVLFAGVILTSDGPKILEYNVRFGDPESSVIFARCLGGLGAALYAIASGQPAIAPIFSDDVAVCVVLATQGYAEAGPIKGDAITGLETASEMEGVEIYYAGVDIDSAGRIITAGGRVLNVVGKGDTLKIARQRALAAAKLISWGQSGPHYRTDIGAE